MSEENLDPSSPSLSENVEAEAPAVMQPAVGEQLRAAREAKGLRSADVAQALKLSTRQVDALEAGDWSGLPGQTFIRGFVRNYARLLRLDPDVLVGQLDPRLMPELPRLDVSSSISAALPRTGGPQRRDFMVVLAGLLLVVLAVLAFFFVPPDFWQSRLAEWSAASARVDAPATGSSAPIDAAPAEPAPPVAPPPAPEAPAPTAAAAAAPVSAASTPAAQPVLQPVSQPSQPLPQSAAPPAPVAAPAAQPASPAAATAPARAGGVQLAFTQPSWVEIRDRSGQIIFSQLNPAGSQRYVEGEPPFALVVGNATHVTVKYKGKPVELSQRSKDDVARLTLE